MSDVQKYIEARSKREKEFAEGFEIGYTDFKIGVVLRQARESAGMTQEQVAKKLSTVNLQFHASKTMPMMYVCPPCDDMPKRWEQVCPSN
jgi:hypothetical protein